MEILQDMSKDPLVSIIIYNYNYGRYLSACFDSVINQSYQNIEILFSDNASTDDSWKIAQSYSQRFPNLFFLAKNRKNFGGAANQKNCLINIRGKYTIFLGSDDMIKPDYISTCVVEMERHLDAAFVMVHRSIIDEHGNEIEEAPFYDNNYKLYPPSQVGVYFMTPINPSISQVFYRSASLQKPGHMNTLNDLYFGHRFVDFLLCLEMPIIYLKKALIAHRIHRESQSQRATENLIQVIGQYLLNHQLKEMTLGFDLKVVDKKFEESIKKIAAVSLRYSADALVHGKPKLAKKYWHLSLAIAPELERSKLAEKLSKALETEEQELIKSLESEYDSKLRAVPYKPDPPFERI